MCSLPEMGRPCFGTALDGWCEKQKKRWAGSAHRFFRLSVEEPHAQIQIGGKAHPEEVGKL